LGLVGLGVVGFIGFLLLAGAMLGKQAQTGPSRRPAAQGLAPSPVLSPRAAPPAPRPALPAAPASVAAKGESEAEPVESPAENAPDLPEPAPQLEVAAVYGAVVGTSYWIKGKVMNGGDAPATGVVVKVQLLDGESLIEEIEAEIETKIEAGTKVKFEAAYSGEGLKRIRDLKAVVTWAEQKE